MPQRAPKSLPFDQTLVLASPMFLPTGSNTHWRNITPKKSQTLDFCKRKRKEGRGKEEERRKRKEGRRQKKEEGRMRQRKQGRKKNEEERRKRKEGKKKEGIPNRLLSQTNIYLMSMQVAISSLRLANTSSELIIVRFHVTRTNIQGHLKQQWKQWKWILQQNTFPNQHARPAHTHTHKTHKQT